MNDSQSFEGIEFMNKGWLFVGLTSFFELIWILGFNIATVWWHWIFIIGFIVIDFYFLTKACELLPTGTVYAVFAAVGTLGTSLMDVFIFNEAINAGKVFFIVILIVGVAGLKMADSLEEQKLQEGVK